METSDSRAFEPTQLFHHDFMAANFSVFYAKISMLLSLAVNPWWKAKATWNVAVLQSTTMSSFNREFNDILTSVQRDFKIKIP